MKESWEIKKLGEVAVIGAGNSAPQKKELFENGKFPFFRTSDIGQIRKGFIETSVDNLNERGIKGLKLFQKGTILFPKSGASTFLNHRVLMNVDGYVSNHLATIKAKSLIADDRFLLYYLITIDAKDLMQDIAYPSLKTSDIGLISIPIPSLPEQQRIVSILDDAFAKIDKAKDNAEQNLKNVKELFENSLHTIFSMTEKNWENSRLGDVCLINDGTHFSPKNTSEGKYKYITAKNIKPYYIDLSKISYVSEKDHKEIYSRCSPVIGDVLYIKDGATAGIATINTLDEEFSLLSSVALLKCSSKILNTFLVHYMNSTFGRKNFLGYIGGAAITRLTLIKIKNVVINLPPIKKQISITQDIDELHLKTKKLETIYNQKIKDLEELKKSMLHKAFNGEL